MCFYGFGILMNFVIFVGFVGSMSYISSMGLCGFSRFGRFFGLNCFVSSMGSESSLVSMGY